MCRCQDVALLDKLIKEDLEAGKRPLLLIANAGEGQSPFKLCIFHVVPYRNDSFTSRSATCKLFPAAEIWSFGFNDIIFMCFY